MQHTNHSPLVYFPIIVMFFESVTSIFSFREQAIRRLPAPQVGSNIIDCEDIDLQKESIAFNLINLHL